MSVDEWFIIIKFNFIFNLNEKRIIEREYKNKQFTWSTSGCINRLKRSLAKTNLSVSCKNTLVNVSIILNNNKRDLSFD